MSRAKYVQQGETLDCENATADKVQAGEIISMVSRIGVAGTDIEPGAMGTVHVTGVFKMDKTEDVAIPMGTALYYDGTGITSQENDGASSNPTAYIPAGYAAADAAAGDAHVIVKLIG